MFGFLTTLLLAQTPPQSPPQQTLSRVQEASATTTKPLAPVVPDPFSDPAMGLLVPQEVRSLPGRLDNVPVFYSNSPEVIQKEGILLSTFPSQGKQYPNAHLNYPLKGRFDIFAHHVAKTSTPDDTPTLFLGILLYNPSRQPIKVDVLQAASYLGTPDAPFVKLPSVVENLTGSVYSGPGSRVTNQILRGKRQTNWPAYLVLQPNEAQMLMNLPVPVPKLKPQSRGSQSKLASQSTAKVLITPSHLKNLAPSSNTRSTLMYLSSNGPVYVASMALYARRRADGSEQIPDLKDWINLLVRGDLAGPRDIPPSPLGIVDQPFYYGRVAGVTQGSQWQAQITDGPKKQNLTIPQPGQAFSYGLSTLNRGTFGTGQIQSAPMLVRYPDTAYLSHGNYAVHYNLTLPLYNPTNQPQAIEVAVQTPLKQDFKDVGLRFLDPPPPQVFFRGTVRLRYNDDQGGPQTRFFHIVQQRGQQSNPLVTLLLQPRERRLVQVDYLYPPDATPPQVLTVKTLPDTGLGLSAQQMP